jgi:hypothetical protein
VARFTPLITLGTVAALGGGLLFVNTTTGGPATTAGNAAAPPAVVQEADPPGPSAAPGAPGAPSAPAPGAPPPAAPGAPPAPPGPPPALAEVAYAGRSAGNEVTVAVAVKDGKAVGYVCDGKEVEAWLEGTLTGSDLRLSGGEGGSSITATVSEAATFGTITVDGEELPFAAEDVEAPAGLYEGRASVRGVATRIGWIVDGEGKVTGVANARGVRRTAPALDPADPDATRIDGVPVTVTPLDGADEVIGR